MKPHTKKSLSVIIPAYNEEKNLAGAVSTIDKSVKQIFDDYELIILNDGSSDKTGLIAAELAKKNPKIRFVDFKVNRGVGAMYQEGIMRARKEYVIMLPGDDETADESVTEILLHTGEADMVTSYTINKEARPLLRRIVSTSFTAMLNILFGFHLKYYTGLVVYKTDLVKKVKMTTNSFAFQAEIIIRLLKGGHSYKEVPMVIRRYDRAGAGWKKVFRIFRIRNIIGVLMTVIRLFFDIRLGKNIVTK